MGIKGHGKGMDKKFFKKRKHLDTSLSHLSGFRGVPRRWKQDLVFPSSYILLPERLAWLHSSLNGVFFALCISFYFLSSSFPMVHSTAGEYYHSAATKIRLMHVGKELEDVVYIKVGGIHGTIHGTKTGRSGDLKPISPL